MKFLSQDRVIIEVREYINTYFIPVNHCNYVVPFSGPFGICRSKSRNDSVDCFIPFCGRCNYIPIIFIIVSFLRLYAPLKIKKVSPVMNNEMKDRNRQYFHSS